MSLKPLIGPLITRLSAEDCFRQWTKRERKDIDNLSGWLVWFMVFIATFTNISVILWRSVLLMEEIGVPAENHRPVASH